ncbi:MAG: hypothetical protein V1662_00020 [Candidatus Omnitrophota bacterium]
MKYLFTLIFFLSMGFCSLCFGAEQTEEKPPILCNGDQVEFLEQEQRLIAAGNVEIIYGDVKINGDKADICLATKEGIIEGNVVVYQKDSVLSGEKATYNFDAGSGVIQQANFSSQLIYGKTPYAVKEGPNKISTRKSYMTTCDLAEPHYRIMARSADMFLNDKVIMRNVIIYVGDIPLFYLPYYSYDMKPTRPRVTILPGKDKDWGVYFLTGWRYEFNQYLKGLLHLDYREKKDVASGFDNYYTTNRFGEGFFKTYYMNERTLEGKHFWKQPRITHEKERYMIHTRHNWKVDPRTDLRLEYWGLSDTTMLKDYFYKNDYERESSPESYLTLSRWGSYYNFNLLAKKRFNKVFSCTEYQPQLKLDIPDVQIGGEDSKFYWKSENSFANLDKKEASPSNIDEDTVRVDSYNQIKHVSKIGFVNVTPYIGGRETYYTKDKYGDHDWLRGALYTGVDFETKFYRIFNVNTSFWGSDINNLRHLVAPKIGYSYIHRPTVASEKLVQFDGIDSIERLDRFNFSLENKLQTKRKVSSEISTDMAEGNLEAVDLLCLLITTSYDYRLPSGSKFSDVTFDVEFTPFNWLALEFDTNYDHLQDKFKSFNLDFYTDSGDKFKYGMGYRYGCDSHSEVILETSFNPTPLWSFGIYERFMFKGYINGLKKINDMRVQEYKIVRDLHCWTSEILYNVSKGEGESIYFVFRMKAFPEMPMEFGTSYHRPKEGSQNSVR